MTNLVEQLKKEILDFKDSSFETSIGKVSEVADGIVRIYGLKEAKLGELLKIETSEGSVSAMALSLEEGSIGAIVLGEYRAIKTGNDVYTSGEILKVPAGEDMISRVVDALGNPIDNKGKIKADKMMEVEKVAPGVITRESVNQPIQTGIRAVDALIPIGRGQRELIIGDRGTGKTAIVLDTFINQKNIDEKSRPICIYVSIGQKRAKVARLVATLKEYGAMDYTIVVSATASDSAPMNYLAPYTGCAIAEYFMGKGKDVIIAYDDLSKQAWAYREISLLLRRPPGREAYPGDIFYLHSRLLERAAKLNKDFGGGSITALPIIETQSGDVSAYIPTNVISITDGQIFLEPDLFYKGIRPAINIGISVSRVGGSAQIKAMKKVAGKLKLDLAQFRELEAFTQFGGDLDEQTKQQIERGRRLTELTKQQQFEPMLVEDQVLILFGATNGLFDHIAVEKVSEIANKMLPIVKSRCKKIIDKINETGNFDDEDVDDLTKAIQEFTKQHEQDGE
jgi:F-type H+-transporting ATPase subunit alpha